MSTRWGFKRAAWVALAVVVATTLAISSAGAAKNDDTPVTRTVFGPTEPENAPGQSLSLQIVTIAPGAKLPEHFHEGTQLATIRSGVLTYSVVSGVLQVTRKGGKAETVTGPATVKLVRGDTIVEAESLAHYGANEGTRPLVIQIAALLRDGAEYSTPVGGGATGAKAELKTTLSSQARTLAQVGASNQVTYGTNRLTGTATLDGAAVGVEMLASVQYTNGNGPFSGFVTYTFADGSTLAVSMQGITVANANGTDATFTATLGVVGGTGKYASTAGTGTFSGQRSAALGGDVAATFELVLR